LSNKPHLLSTISRTPLTSMRTILLINVPHRVSYIISSHLLLRPRRCFDNISRILLQTVIGNNVHVYVNVRKKPKAKSRIDNRKQSTMETKHRTNTETQHRNLKQLATRTSLILSSLWTSLSWIDLDVLIVCRHVLDASAKTLPHFTQYY